MFRNLVSGKKKKKKKNEYKKQKSEIKALANQRDSYLNPKQQSLKGCFRQARKQFVYTSECRIPVSKQINKKKALLTGMPWALLIDLYRWFFF